MTPTSPMPSEFESAKSAAAQLLASGIFATDVDPTTRQLQGPIPIFAPDETFAGWLVGLSSGESLAGFFILDTSLSLRRYSSFVRTAGSLAGCPRLAEWLDPAQVLATARSVAHLDEELSEPILGFDRSPERIAWMVRATNTSDHRRTIFVIGDFAYPETPAGNEPSTG